MPTKRLLLKLIKSVVFNLDVIFFFSLMKSFEKLQVINKKNIEVNIVLDLYKFYNLFIELTKSIAACITSPPLSFLLTNERSNAWS